MSSKPPVLEMICKLCQISQNCSQKGSSPLILKNGIQIKCRIVGGYSKKEVDDSKLSIESKEMKTKNGPCFSIAEVPALDESGRHVLFNITKIFHKPILHPREKTDFLVDMMYPKSHR